MLEQHSETVDARYFHIPLSHWFLFDLSKFIFKVFYDILQFVDLMSKLFILLLDRINIDIFLFYSNTISKLSKQKERQSSCKHF